MKANPKIFKAYDVRGEWNTDWDAEFVYRIGQAIFQHFRPKTVTIGRDMRLSSDEIFEQLSQALVEQGVNVLDLGLCATELSYFTSGFMENVDLCIMITGSHNLGKDNGLKITVPKGVVIGLDTGLDKIRDLALTVGELKPSEIRGEIKKYDAWSSYQQHVLDLANSQDLPSLKIVIDPGNGMGGYLFDKVLSHLKLDVVKMNWEPDGSFPNHQPDPIQEKNVEDLKRKVIEEGADIGISLDGDGDRVFFVDEKGRYIQGYYLAALLTDYILEEHKQPHKETVVYDPRCYRAIEENIAKHGATPRKWKAGYTLLKRVMRKENALFGTECSGHIFYRKTHYCESTMLTILNMLKIIAKKGKLSEIMDKYYRDFPVSGEVNFVVDNIEKTLEDLKNEYAGAQLDFLDGIDIMYPNWRCSVRSSNTQPLIRVNVEGNDKELVKRKFDEVTQIIGGTRANH